jgi:hypothetical protein
VNRQVEIRTTITGHYDVGIVGDNITGFAVQRTFNSRYESECFASKLYEEINLSDYQYSDEDDEQYEEEPDEGEVTHIMDGNGNRYIERRFVAECLDNKGIEDYYDIGVEYVAKTREEDVYPQSNEKPELYVEDRFGEFRFVDPERFHIYVTA